MRFLLHIWPSIWFWENQNRIPCEALITSAKANVYLNILSFYHTLALMDSEKLNTHRSQFIRIILIYLEGRGGGVVSPPSMLPQGLVVLVKYWLAVLMQVLMRNCPKYIFLLYYFFLICFFGEVKIIFIWRNLFFLLQTFS